VSNLSIRLTEKSEVEFGGVAGVLALDQETGERVNAVIAVTVRTATLQVIRRTLTANLSLPVSNGTAIVGKRAWRFGPQIRTRTV
jgi:hypothetical protein